MPAQSVWGKTDRRTDEWMPLVQHLEDAAGVAGFLWDSWLPTIVKNRLARDIGSERDARQLVCFLAGTHDVGKASPAFAQLAYDVQMGHLVSAMERAGLTSPLLPRRERQRHTVTGHLAMSEWLKRRYGYSAHRAGALASIVSAHHGTTVESDAHIDAIRRLTGAMGDAAWDSVRDEILDTMADLTQVSGTLASLKDTKFTLHSLIDLSAIVVVADWISSDESRFPYECRDDSGSRLQSATSTLDLRAPWQPPRASGGEPLFRDRFPHLEGVHPTPLQLDCVDAAGMSETAPLMVIEAPTGAGKSEAAFMAAETLAGRFGAGGVYVGLPTMATSNAMFSRVLNWVDRWPSVVDPTIWLAHGKAALNDDFAEMVRDSRIRGISDDEDRQERGSARVSSWLSGRRRGLLSNVVVGTIDQVLMGALQARHLALRHLALSSKVVVVDEVHSADTFMRSFLVRMLEYLGGYGTPVVLLSATLPPSQRAELVGAYQRGRTAARAPTGGLVSRRRRQPADAGESRSSAGTLGPGPEVYPVITVASDQVSFHPVEPDHRRFEIAVAPLGDDLETLVEMLDEALQDGGCVIVLRNTVRRAQETYDALRARFGDDVELFHSRFIAPDRASRERSLVGRLGPNPDQRPRRLVVVGTQVLEQSLDIDADLMVTDLAPVDLIIQRLGRMHRHARPSDHRPERLRKPRCLITGIEDWGADVPHPVRGSRTIYGDALLLRSLRVLHDHLHDAVPIVLPEDGPRLVHQAYDPDLRPRPGWESAWTEAERRRDEVDENARSKASLHHVPDPATHTSLTGWTTVPVDDAREDTGRAQVRDTEDGIEVIVVQEGDDGSLRLLDGDFPGAGRSIPIRPIDGEPITRHLAACTVPLPQNLTNPRRWEATVAELEAAPIVENWQESKWLQGQLALILDRDGCATLNDHHIRYNSTRGLEVSAIARDGAA